MTQWTRVQAELATLTFPQIGSICSVSPSGEPVIGRLASSAAELRDAGPFSRAVEYFAAIANTMASKLDLSVRLGARVFRDILDRTTLFGDMDTTEQFPLNHMDLGTQNILVDDKYNFIAIIDWEFAQTAPWQVNTTLCRFLYYNRTLKTSSEILAISPTGMCYGKTFLDNSIARSSKRPRGCWRRRADLLAGRLRRPSAVQHQGHTLASLA